jgi:hypothetical protein
VAACARFWADAFAAATAAAPTGWPHFGQATHEASSMGALQAGHRPGANGSRVPHLGQATTSRLM